MGLTDREGVRYYGHVLYRRGLQNAKAETYHFEYCQIAASINLSNPPNLTECSLSKHFSLRVPDFP